VTIEHCKTVAQKNVKEQSNEVFFFFSAAFVRLLSDQYFFYTLNPKPHGWVIKNGK
jgi:hypothetical protein